MKNERSTPIRQGQSRVGILKNEKSAYSAHTGTTGHTTAMDMYTPHQK